MSEIVPPRIPAGMRDILPEQMIKRQYVLDVVRTVFEEFGFEPLQTSAIELSETLMGKYGPDAERLIYKAWYGSQPGDEFALRYDLSVPLSRVVAMYPELSRPFKRYQIAPVWRADRPQKGRYREFFQCDVDIVGTTSMLADAEIVAVVYEVLRRLGFSGVSIAINNRKLLDGIGQYAGVPESLLAGLYRAIDKLDKIGLDGVRRELLMVGVPEEPMQPIQKIARLGIQGKLSFEDMPGRMVQEGLEPDLSSEILEALQALVQTAIEQEVPGNALQAVTRDIAHELAPALRAFYGKTAEIIPADVVENLLELLQITGAVTFVLDDLEARLAGIPKALDGIQELRDLFAYLSMLGVEGDACVLNFAMVRGLEYYTGPIFETTVTEPKAMPSITGGGRYDELIGLFSSVTYPATGTSLGIERIIDVMEELAMFPESINTTTSDVLVTVFDAGTQAASLQAATALRQAGIRTSVFYDIETRLGEQLGYASTKGIPFVVIIGPDELADGVATVRYLGKAKSDSEQRVVPLAELVEVILNW